MSAKYRNNWTEANLAEVQSEMLKLLLIVDKICRENSLQYWLDGGTLLGAIRHSGVIPWDDDTDICLLKKDYDKLLLLLKQEEKKNQEIFLLFYNKSDRCYWSEYLCSRDIILETYGQPFKPCLIDITPIKSILPSEEQEDRKKTDIANYFIRGKIKYPKEFDKKYRKKTLQEAMNIKKEFMDYYNNTYMPSCANKTSDSLFTYAYGDSIVNNHRDYYSYSDIFPLKEIFFEGHKLYIPNKTDTYLSILYGDYMSLPPVLARKPVNKKYYHCHNISASLHYAEIYTKEKNLIFYKQSSYLYKLYRGYVVLRNKGFKVLLTALINHFSIKKPTHKL
jgi:lipopolysaccharide cholinephosphotransferase